MNDDQPKAQEKDGIVADLKARLAAVAQELECLRGRLAATEDDNARLRALLEPCRPDTDAQTDPSYPRTADDVLHLLSAYIADFMEPEAVLDDAYFAAWERQARKVIGPVMEERDTLRGLLREAACSLGAIAIDVLRPNNALQSAEDIREVQDELLKTLEKQP